MLRRQSELLQRFLCGYVNNPDGGVEAATSKHNSKSPLEKLTGVKTSMTQIGKTHKTTVPYRGKDHSMILRTAVGDPGPHVLAWADACLVAFSTADRSSFDVLSSIKRKVEKYRRGTEVPCIFVAVSGLNGQDTIASTAAAAVAVGPLAGVGSGAGSALQTAPVPAVSEFEADINAFNRANPALFQANPITGNGVSIVFEKLVHQVFEKVVPRTRRSKVGKSNRKSRLFSSKAEVRRSTALRCTALHGCCLAETETRGH